MGIAPAEIALDVVLGAAIGVLSGSGPREPPW